MNRIIALVLALLSLFCACPRQSVFAVLKGDVNGDGTVTRADGELVFAYVSGQTSVLEGDLQAADVDGDGAITVGDAAQILRYAAGEEHKLPINYIDRLSILSPPFKTVYTMGDTFSSAGLSVGALYADGQLRIIKSYAVTGYSDLVGAKVITVTARGKRISFAVRVDEPAVSRLEIKAFPNKRCYGVGDSFSTEGLELYAVYENGTRARLSSYSVSGFDGRSGLKTVRFMYMGKSAEFTVGCGYAARVNCGGSRLNVRTGASTNHTVAGTFVEGQSLMVLDVAESDGWLHCYGLAENGEYISGWCYAPYIELIG